ncbi:MAG TPA: hypothetical protein ENG45_02020 [Candidatus Aenigmarchaeota archaeon]|nr:hypothetical protein [Candidatus Aenigmarchaeota archaeon]
MISRTFLRKLLLSAGAKKVSQEAVETLEQVLTEVASEISIGAVEVANTSSRKTVRRNDVLTSYKIFTRALKFVEKTRGKEDVEG